MQPGSPSIMMPALKIPECSPTTKPIDGKHSITKALSVQVLSSLSDGDDYNIGYEPLLMMLANSPI